MNTWDILLREARLGNTMSLGTIPVPVGCSLCMQLQSIEDAVFAPDIVVLNLFASRTLKRRKFSIGSAEPFGDDFFPTTELGIGLYRGQNSFRSGI